ncbi:MAG: hypothetical protein EZS28_014645 [Streblomastix strix]|uniref:Protein kinase domain-containing protein n=1 Tax=Streblomastix strix TaxID=222440 RepID=A0A5J4W4K8_9EUKA|nr:MAG: hypothetical protein EZS28_014645 [Streblomastix strix]
MLALKPTDWFDLNYQKQFWQFRIISRQFRIIQAVNSFSTISTPFKWNIAFSLYQGLELLRIKKKEQELQEAANSKTKVKVKAKQQEELPRIVQTRAADIWTFAVMIFELLTQRHQFFSHSFEGVPAEELTQCIINPPSAERPEHYPQN